MFVIFLGIALGAGAYESRIVVPQWITGTDLGGYYWDADVARKANTGERFWVYVTTVPLTLLTVASIILAWRTHGQLRRWWLAAGLLTVVDRLLTFGYFIPKMLQPTAGERLPQAEAVPLATQWLQLDYLRVAISLLAFLAALRALSVLSSDRNTTPTSVGSCR